MPYKAIKKQPGKTNSRVAVHTKRQPAKKRVPITWRATRRTKLVVGCAAVCLGILVFSGQHFLQAAAAPIVTVPVYTTADQPVTVLTKSVTLQPGQKAYVYHYPLAVKVYSWGKGKPANIGSTTAIACTDINGAEVVRAHWAANITPTDTPRKPVVRLLLDQPAGGTFTCKLLEYGYSTQAASGMKLGVYADGGYTPGIRVGVYAAASTWTAHASGTNAGLSITPGATIIYASQVVDVPKTASSWTLIADGQLTTCTRPTAYPPVCNKASTKLTSSSVATWISIQPKQADGVTSCGTPLFSGTSTAYISNARHHQSMINSFTIPKATLVNAKVFPSNCTKAQVMLRAKVTAGNYVIAHTEYNYVHALSLINP